MERTVERYPYLKRRAGMLESKIAQNQMLVRGHDAFEFLQVYMKQIHNIQIGFAESQLNDLKQIVVRFKVEMCNS